MKNIESNRKTVFCTKILKINFLSKGSEGRVVTLSEVSSDASKEDLLEYRKLPPSDSHELDDVCCWGKVYRFKRNKFDAKFKEEVTKRYPEGFKEVRTTFYPMVSIK